MGTGMRVALQHVMVPAVLVLLLLGSCAACNHQKPSLPRPLMQVMHALESASHGQKQQVQMMHVMQQHVQESNNVIATPAAAGPPGTGSSCAALHDKQKCTGNVECIWCQNKHSPWPGSDGVCIEPDQAKYLPDSTYSCTPKPTEVSLQPEEQLEGGSQSCGTIQDEQKCSAKGDCLWCQNKHSPWPGSAVCMHLGQARYLSDSAYKCKSKTAKVVAEATATEPKPPSKSCAIVHYKDQCALRQDCIWCQNKLSPWSGSDGVCIEPEHEYELPKWTYKCQHKHTNALAAA